MTKIITKIKQALCKHNWYLMKWKRYYAQSKGLLHPYAVDVDIVRCLKCEKVERKQRLIWDEPMIGEPKDWKFNCENV